MRTLLIGALTQFDIAIKISCVALDMNNIVIKQVTNGTSLLIKSKINFLPSLHSEKEKPIDLIKKDCTRFGRLALSLCKDIDAIAHTKLTDETNYKDFVLKIARII